MALLLLYNSTTVSKFRKVLEISKIIRRSTRPCDHASRIQPRPLVVSISSIQFCISLQASIRHTWISIPKHSRRCTLRKYSWHHHHLSILRHWCYCMLHVKSPDIRRYYRALLVNKSTINPHLYSYTAADWITILRTSVATIFPDVAELVDEYVRAISWHPSPSFCVFSRRWSYSIQFHLRSSRQYRLPNYLSQRSAHDKSPAHLRHNGGSGRDPRNH